MDNKKFFTLPNLITIFRFFLMVPFFILDFNGNHEAGIVSTIILFFVFFGDCVDGYVARKFHSESDWGKILDPVLDKLTFITLSVYFYYFYQMPLWVPLMFIIREFVILLGADIYRKHESRLPVSNFWGKLSTTFWGLIFGAFYIKWPFFYQESVYVGLVLIIISSFVYLWRYKNNMISWQMALWLISLGGTVFFEIYLFRYREFWVVGPASFIFFLFVVLTLILKQNDILHGWFRSNQHKDHSLYSNTKGLLKKDFFKVNFFKLLVSYLEVKLIPPRSIWVFFLNEEKEKTIYELKACNQDANCRQLFKIEESEDNIIFKKHEEIKKLNLISHVHPEDEKEFIDLFKIKKMIIFPIFKSDKPLGLVMISNEYIMSEKQEQMVEFIIYIFNILLNYQGMIMEQKETGKGKSELEEKAAISEMTAGVLHNIGNAVTSTLVKTQLSKNLIESMNTEGLEKTRSLLEKNKEAIKTLFDKKGDSLLKYIKIVLDELDKKKSTSIEHLDFIFSKLQHIGEIISIQQSYSNLKIFKEFVSINQIIQENFSLYEDSLEKRNIVKEFYFREDIPMLLLEPAGLMQVFSNLVKNSIEAIDGNPEGEKRIIVRTDLVDIQKKKFVKVVFSDTGVGITSDNLNKISNYGFTTKKTGHGFGLHYSFNFIKKAGGMIKIRSEGINTGVSFLLYLPLDNKQEK